MNSNKPKTDAQKFNEAQVGKESNEVNSSEKRAAYKYIIFDEKKALKEAAKNMDAMTSAVVGEDIEFNNTLTNDLSDLEKQLDTQASISISKVLEDSYRAFAAFDKFEKMNVYRYFYKTNPLLGRSIDLHVDLPLSKVRLVPPKNVPSELAKDYVSYFYNTVFERIDLFAFLRDFILHYRIYGEAFGFVEDSYGSLSDSLELVSPEKLSEIYADKTVVLNPDDQKFLLDTEIKYANDPKSVSLVDRNQYVSTIFPYFNKEYKGIDRVSVVDFYKIDEYHKNYSSEYKAIKIKVDSKIRENINEMDDDDLRELGITKSFYDLIIEADAAPNILVDNNAYKIAGNSSYIFDLGYGKTQTSIIHRVIDQAFEWEALKSAIRTKILLVGKVGRVITAAGIGEDQLQALQAEFAMMGQNPDAELIVNFDVSIQEYNTNVKDDLKELISDYDRLKEEISMGIGVPLSLIGGDSQFSGEVIRLEIMNNEYLNFKNLITKVIEDYILKPIAIRKGFYRSNEWGDVELIYPSISFSRTSLRSESQYDVLFSMYSKGSLPSSIIYELLNIDSESVSKELKNELFSLKNPYFGEFFNSVLSNATAEIGQNPEIYKRLKEMMGLKSEAPESAVEDLQNEENSEQDKLGDLKFSKKASPKINEKKDLEDKQPKFLRPDLKKNIDPKTLKKVVEEKHKIKSPTDSLK